jgi:hypothetical protein
LRRWVQGAFTSKYKFLIFVDISYFILMSIYFIMISINGLFRVERYDKDWIWRKCGKYRVWPNCYNISVFMVAFRKEVLPYFHGKQRNIFEGITLRGLDRVDIILWRFTWQPLPLWQHNSYNKRFYGNAGDRCLGNTHGYNKRSTEWQRPQIYQRVLH